MAGDYSRFRFKPEKNYSDVLKQQGRVSLDSDWNELEEIQDRRMRSGTIDTVGSRVVPENTPDAFKIIPTGEGTFDIGIGRFYVDGMQVENHGNLPLEFDPELEEEKGTTPVPYSDQPYLPAPLPLSLTRPEVLPIEGRQDLVYLDVWKREVTAVEDSDLKEIALGGPDTTCRIQTAWQVKVLENVGDLSCGDVIEDWDKLVAPSGGRLTTSLVAPPPDDSPCAVNPAGGYTGLENRLYRVEIHKGGPLGTAKFKWSKNNCSLVAGVTAVSESSGNGRITVQSLGKDKQLRFNIGYYVEILDDHVEFQGLPGHMAKILDIDEANRILTVSAPVPTALGLDPSDPARHTRIRLWDGQTGVDSDGLLTTGAGPISIEKGIQVAFGEDTSQAAPEFKVGDFWVFAARTADGSLELLENAPPRGIHHHYVRLARVCWSDGSEPTRVFDCRRFWPPAQCCTIAVRPGEDIQVAIDALPEEGGCVCLLPGIHQAVKPLLVDGRKNILLTGQGNASKLVFLPLLEERRHEALIYVVGASQDIEISHLLLHADNLSQLIVIDEKSQNVSVSRCTLINGNSAKDDHIAAVLLSDCCGVSITDSDIVSTQGIVQAAPEAVRIIQQILSALRSRPTDENPDTADNSNGNENKASALTPTVTLKGLCAACNRIYSTAYGILLRDALTGKIAGNQLRTVPLAALKPFARPRSDNAPSDALSATFYLGLDNAAAELSPCASPSTEEKTDNDVSRVKSIALSSWLMEDFEITANIMEGAVGTLLQYCRSIQIEGNEIRATLKGIAVGFGFELRIVENRIYVGNGTRSYSKKDATPFSCYWQRYYSGTTGIAPGFVRGIRISENTIQAETGVANGFHAKRLDDGFEIESVLRIFQIAPVWHVSVEIAWLVYHLVQTLLTAAGAEADEDEIKCRCELEKRIFEWFKDVLASADLPALFSKVSVSGNEMQALNFGVLLNEISAMGGMEINENRVSGFEVGGIVVRPAFYIGCPETEADLLRCLFTWVILIVKILRDRLTAMLNQNEDEGETDTTGNTTVDGIIAVISWIQVLCARYCGAPADNGNGEEPTEPSPLEALRDALDDFLSRVDLGWLDDFVNGSFEIRENDLSGMGDGIEAGFDGFHIIDNRVVIWQSSTVPRETLIFSLMLSNRFQNLREDMDALDLLTSGTLDGDRDFVLLGSIGMISWVEEHFDTAGFLDELRQFSSDLLPYIHSSSPLLPPMIELQESMDASTTNTVDRDKVQAAFIKLLETLVCHLVGYGIFMRGGNMTCRGNQVVAKSGCSSDTASPGSDTAGSTNRRRKALKQDVNIVSAVTVNGRTPVLTGSAVGGIWHYSNLLGSAIDLLKIVYFDKKELKNVYKLVFRLIDLLILQSQKNRFLKDTDNSVNNAAFHGIRSFGDWALSDVDIFDNTVRDSVRHCVHHMGLLAPEATLKIHRNTVVKTETDELLNLLSRYQKLAAGTAFSTLVWIDNAEGATLMMSNHGDAKNAEQKGNVGVYINTAATGVQGNHILVSSGQGFYITALRGLFTDNLTRGTNSIHPSTLIQGPNVENV